MTVSPYLRTRIVGGNSYRLRPGAPSFLLEMESLEADWVDVATSEGPPDPPLSSSITFHLNGMLITEHDPSPVKFQRCF